MITDREIKEMHDKFKYLEKKIKEYDNIVIYRHKSPDFDAFGSQMGLYTWIKDNYPNKDVHFVGDDHITMTKALYPVPEDLDESWYDREHLAITVDISNRPRLACDHLDKAKEVIKIDHHPIPEKEEERFGDYLIVYKDRPAASEIVALFALSRSKKFKLSKQAAAYLYSGIVGDTGRFLYQDSDSATMRISADLLDTGFDKTAIYNEMYKTDMRRMNILKFVLNNYKITEKGTCYYVLKKEDLEALNMPASEGNLHINTFRNLEGVNCVASITWSEEKQEYRVSLRSLLKPVAHIANKYNGGGHDFAAGCRIKTLDELDGLIKDLDTIGD